MLTLLGGQLESLWGEVLPIEARELPDDLARLDRVLSDSMLLVPVAEAWELGALERGRPSIPIATFVRLMVVKQRTGWGYETLVREVSDSLHHRRFCLIAIDQRVPDESTVRKLARRLGAEVVQGITRMVIEKAQRETRFIARSTREAKRLAAAAAASARGRGAKAKLRAAKQLEELASRCQKVVEQIDRRVRGLILLAGHEIGNPAENKLLPQTAVELDRAGIRPREIVLDGGFMPGPTRRISHLKRGHGLRRSRLNGDDGTEIWTSWAILVYDLDTLAIRTR